MFWAVVYAIISVSYFIYRLRKKGNRKLFFKSALFKILTGSIALLTLSIIFVNSFFTDFYIPPHLDINRLTAEETNIDYEFLVKKDSRYHYGLIKKLQADEKHEGRLTELRTRYEKMVLDSDRQITSIGNFGLGACAIGTKDFAHAKKYLLSVKNNQLPLLHYCLGVTYYTLDDSVSGEAELMTELSVSGGDHENAFRYLYDWHSSRENYKELHQLMGYDELAQTLFSPSLARTTNLVVGDFPGYVLWLIRSITNDMTVFGFFAAALISLIWMMYASRLDKIVPHRYWMMFLMFVGGSIFTFLVLPFSDIMEIQTQWYRTGDFFNDLLYCVLMIAVPEETVKILPLLILVAVGSKRIQPIDYIIYACASALGFAFIENILYFGGLNPASIHGRAYLAAIGHMVDTSIVAYGFVLTKFRHQNEKPMRNLLTTFSLACLAHGLYDFFIFQELILLFFIFFILVVQFWIIMINNCLNNSSRFTYFVGDHYERSKVYLTLSLVAIMSIEYVRAGWVSGALEANLEHAGNSIFSIFLLTFFSSSLSSFDLVKGYWRKITFINHEKRGYGTRSRVSPLMSWYLVNAIRSHNYIGKRIVITNHPFNATLAGVIYGKHHGKIVNRVILYKDGIADPYWFIVKLVDRIPFADDLNEYILVKLRYQEDYMEHDDEVEVFFKAIRDPKLLRVAEPPKDEFPFYGWALMSLDRSKKQIPAETPHFNSQKIN